MEDCRNSDVDSKDFLYENLPVDDHNETDQSSHFHGHFDGEQDTFIEELLGQPGVIVQIPGIQLKSRTYACVDPENHDRVYVLAYNDKSNKKLRFR